MIQTQVLSLTENLRFIYFGLYLAIMINSSLPFLMKASFIRDDKAERV